MKKFTLTVASLLISGLLLAQDYTPPSRAIEAFTSKYPDGNVQEWYEGFEDVECYFENDGNFGSAHFTDEGDWLYSEYTLDESDLPTEVSGMLTEDFDGYEVSDVVMTESDEETTYAITIYKESNDDNRIVTYNTAGDLIDEVLITEDDDSFE